MTQPNQNFVLTQPLHFESEGFVGNAGDVCVWRAPGQLVVYRSGTLVANFRMSYLSVQALKSEAIFSTGKTPKGIDLSAVPPLEAPEVTRTTTVVDAPVKAAKVAPAPVVLPPAPEVIPEVLAPAPETPVVEVEKVEAPVEAVEAPKAKPAAKLKK